MPTRLQVWKPYCDGGGLAIGTNCNAANSNKNENSNSNTTQVVRKDGMDYTNYNNTEMQQRIALARANSGYIAPSDKQAYHRTTNNSKSAGGISDGTTQTSSTTPLLGEHTKRRKKTLDKVVFDVEKAPPRPPSTTSTSFGARLSMHQLDEASNVQKDDNDSDEDSHDKAFYKDLCAKLTERLEIVNARKKKLEQKLNALKPVTKPKAKEESAVEYRRQMMHRLEELEKGMKDAAQKNDFIRAGKLQLQFKTLTEAVQSCAVNRDNMIAKYRQEHFASNSDENKALIQKIIRMSETTKDTNAVVKRNNVL